MQKRLLASDPAIGLTEYHHYESVTDRTVIETVQDVEPILERNKALQNDDAGGWSPTRELRRAATIPDIVILKWRREDGIDVYDPDHWPAVKRKLNSSEYRWLRTAPGTL